MKLSAYISQINQSFADASGESISSVEQGLKNGMEAIYGKQPGQAVTGEVLKLNGTEILLALGKNQLLQAKLEGNMSPQIGQQLTFQIRSNMGGKVILSPLFENVGQDTNILKALEQAGIPENDVTAGMVKAMMTEGLAVDKQSLYQMLRLINANPQADIQSLVSMQRLGISVTPETIVQFEAYRNYEHQLGAGLTDIADAFSKSFQEITGNHSIQDGVRFYQEVLSILAKEEAGGDVTGELSSREAWASAKASLPVEEVLSKEELGKLSEELKQAGAGEKIINDLLSGKMGVRELLKEAGELPLEDAELHEALFRLFDGKEMKQLLKTVIHEQWLLAPEEVGEEEGVEKLYERLNEQVKQLNKALLQVAREDTPLARAVSNVSGNIDFMNQINQMFSYVQLPLKMQGKETNGELFVYTNKKSLAKKEGAVSALLHLDMEHLGSVDVHVTLVEQKVSTKFYLKDDSALDLIAAHIDILNEKLEKRGYSMNAQFLHKEGGGTIMDEMLSQNGGVPVLTGYSFDARA